MARKMGPLPLPPRPDLAASPKIPPRPDRPSRKPRRLDHAALAGAIGLVLLGAVAAFAVANGEVRTPRSLSADQPLVRPGVATSPAATGSSYRFLRQTGLQPWRWNPCEPIHYVVNLVDAPEGALADVQKAVERVRSATGIPFVYDGITSEQLGDGFRLPYMPRAYGKRWAPVLITWVVPDETELEFVTRGDHRAVGLASPIPPPTSPQDQWVSGWIAINAELRVPAGFDYSGARGLVLQHELGHVMGLRHVHVVGEVMHPADGGAIDWGPGDRAGLHELGGSSGCLSQPELPKGSWWRALYRGPPAAPG
jgi:hypothetical protein